MIKDNPTPNKERVGTSVATPPQNLFRRGVYTPGDGEVAQAKRPGAEDHLLFKTRGNPT